MPKENDDADHDKIIQSTETAVASTATAPTRPDATQSQEAPPASEHPQRPTKPAAKPAPEPTSSDAAMPPGTGTEQQAATSTEAASGAATTSPSSSWISWLPTLGASKAAQPWIYGAVGLIAAFCIGLGISFWIIRRRRLQNITDGDYDFQVLDEEEGEGLNSGEKTFAGGKRRGRRTRGGELYDAFAAGTDDEDDEFDQYSDRSSDSRLPGDREGEQYVVGEETDDDDDDNDRTTGNGETRRLT